MTPNDDLSRWGEPPASDAELELARRLGDWLDRDTAVADARLRELVRTVLAHCGLDDNVPSPAGPGSAGPVGLHVRLHRQWEGRLVPLVATHPRASLRDLRRDPDADRVTLRAGDRVRVEVECDRDGYLTVFNVGPTGNLNVLWPDDLGRAAARRAGEPVAVADVEVTPPHGRERVYAVWSAVPLGLGQLDGLTRRAGAVRDMRPVAAAVESLRPEQWHAVVLEIEHRG
ncbi:MAG: DUF4384 domain-containing protein [Gemmataceae bacterium]